MHPRIQKLKQPLSNLNLDALLITNPTNVFYLTGLTSPNPQAREVVLLVTPNESLVFTSPLIATTTKTLSPKLLPSYLKNYRQVGFEANNLTVAEHSKFATSTTLIPTTDLVENLRMIKDAAEIATLTKAGKLTRDTIKHLHLYIKPGRSERSIAWEAEKYMREHGAEELAFPTIIASGPNSAIPHHTTSNRKITKNDIVLVDLGAKINGYCGDMTRTFFVGTPTSKQLKIESIVKSAHTAAISSLVASRYPLVANEVDTSTRQVINSSGYGKHFIHSTGHGLGLDIHEQPSLSPSPSLEARSYPLEANMVITIEPGIYLSGKFGYRHEDTILITKTGPKVLTKQP